MARATIVWLLMIAASGAAAESRRADAPVYGTGMMLCAQATTPERIAASREWLFGYLTAFGESFGPPVAWLSDNDTVSAVFDESCATFPKFTLVEAARWVILTLQVRHYDKRK